MGPLQDGSEPQSFLMCSRPTDWSHEVTPQIGSNLVGAFFVRFFLISGFFIGFLVSRTRSNIQISFSFLGWFHRQR